MITYAYFKSREEVAIDLLFTTGSIDISIQPGIDTSLTPGQETEYNYFEIANEGTLDQNIDIDFKDFSNISNEDLQNIVYELQLKDNKNNYKTIIKSNLSDLKNIKLQYDIRTKCRLEFKSKLYVLQNIDEHIYNQNVKLNMYVKAYQTNDNNKNYFVEDAYQTNSLTINQPEIDEPTANDFITTAKIKDGSSVAIIMNLKDYYDVDDNFVFKIKQVYGSLISDFQTVVKNKQKDEINITFAGKYIEIDEIDEQLPSKDKMDVDITYKVKNKSYTNTYTVELIRVLEETNDDPKYNDEIVEAHFYERK